MAGGRANRGKPKSPLRHVNRWRITGLLLAAAAATWALVFVTNERFDLDPAKVSVSELVYTQSDVVRDAIDLPMDATPNVFSIGTRDMQSALESLSSVAAAEVYVTLPNQLTVEITERTPTITVVTGDRAFVIDRDGFVLDETAASEAAAIGLPIVTDERRDYASQIFVGGRLDEVSLDADLRLAALTPELIGTASERLNVTVDDTDGWVVEAQPGGWRAIFGHYTPNLRPVDIIDRQVQCLQARVDAGESDVAVIYLAPLDDGCGTYLPRSTPAPVESAPAESTPVESASPAPAT